MCFVFWKLIWHTAIFCFICEWACKGTKISCIIYVLCIEINNNNGRYLLLRLFSVLCIWGSFCLEIRTLMLVFHSHNIWSYKRFSAYKHKTLYPVPLFYSDILWSIRWVLFILSRSLSDYKSRILQITTYPFSLLPTVCNTITKPL